MSYQYDATYFNTSHYSTAEEAKAQRALYVWHTTYGYSATMDAFINSIDMLKCYDPTVVDEFTFQFTIDKVKFPPMSYKEVLDLFHASYDNFDDGKHKMLEKGEKQFTYIC
jgi:hypothetical protein